MGCARSDGGHQLQPQISVHLFYTSGWRSCAYAVQQWERETGLASLSFWSMMLVILRLWVGSMYVS